MSRVRAETRCDSLGVAVIAGLNISIACSIRMATLESGMISSPPRYSLLRMESAGPTASVASASGRANQPEPDPDLAHRSNPAHRGWKAPPTLSIRMNY
jgi:hypothetical protein